jgi:tetratricopeptide (TPR) repeat protein
MTRQRIVLRKTKNLPLKHNKQPYDLVADITENIQRMQCSESVKARRKYLEKIIELSNQGLIGDELTEDKIEICKRIFMAKSITTELCPRLNSKDAEVAKAIDELAERAKKILCQFSKNLLEDKVVSQYATLLSYRVDDAVCEVVAKALKSFPNNQSLWFFYAAALFELKKYSEVVAACDKGMELLCKDKQQGIVNLSSEKLLPGMLVRQYVFFIYHKGLSLFRNGRYQEALDTFNTIPSYEEWYECEKKYCNDERDLENIQLGWSDYLEVKNMQWKLLYDIFQRYNEAETILEERFKKETANSHLYNAAAVHYLGREDYKKFREYVDKALSLINNKATTSKDKCLTYASKIILSILDLDYDGVKSALKEYEESIAYYQSNQESIDNVLINLIETTRYIASSDCMADILNGLISFEVAQNSGSTHKDSVRKEKYSEAEWYYLQAAQDERYKHIACYFLGNLFVAQNKFDQAAEYYLQAHKCDLNNVQALNGLWHSYLQQEEYDKAYTYLFKAMAIVPENQFYFAALNKLCDYYVVQRDYQKTQACLLQAIKISKASKEQITIEMKMTLARTYLALGDAKTGIKYLLDALNDALKDANEEKEIHIKFLLIIAHLIPMIPSDMEVNNIKKATFFLQAVLKSEKIPGKLKAGILAALLLSHIKQSKLQNGVGQTIQGNGQAIVLQEWQLMVMASLMTKCQEWKVKISAILLSAAETNAEFKLGIDKEDLLKQLLAYGEYNLKQKNYDIAEQLFRGILEYDGNNSRAKDGLMLLSEVAIAPKKEEENKGGNETILPQTILEKKIPEPGSKNPGENTDNIIVNNNVNDITKPKVPKVNEGKPVTEIISDVTGDSKIIPKKLESPLPQSELRKVNKSMEKSGTNDDSPTPVIQQPVNNNEVSKLSKPEKNITFFKPNEEERLNKALKYFTNGFNKLFNYNKTMSSPQYDLLNAAMSNFYSAFRCVYDGPNIPDDSFAFQIKVIAMFLRAINESKLLIKNDSVPKDIKEVLLKHEKQFSEQRELFLSMLFKYDSLPKGVLRAFNSSMKKLHQLDLLDHLFPPVEWKVERDIKWIEQNIDQKKQCENTAHWEWLLVLTTEAMLNYTDFKAPSLFTNRIKEFLKSYKLQECYDSLNKYCKETRGKNIEDCIYQRVVKQKVIEPLKKDDTVITNTKGPLLT